MNCSLSLLFTLLLVIVLNGDAFAPAANGVKRSNYQLNADATATTEEVSIDPKEAVKLFGRLAEKYIMLDASGGMCCYSACKGE